MTSREAVDGAVGAGAEIWSALAPLDEAQRAEFWPLLGGAEADTLDDAAYVADRLAGFVRAHPDAPPEATYRFAAGEDLHPGVADGWADIPFHQRTAYTAFREVLLLLDRLIAAERPAEPPPAPVRPDREGDIEETVFAQGRAPMDVDPALARDLDRPVRIIPAEGDPPGHGREARPRPAPAVPIGPENTTVIVDNRILSQAEFLARDERPATEG